MQRKTTQSLATIKIERTAHEAVSRLAEKEGLTIKDCIYMMTQYFIKNQLSVSIEAIPVSKEISRVIKLIRAQEKDYFIPAMATLNRIQRFQENLLISAEDHLSALDNVPIPTVEKEESNIPNEPDRGPIPAMNNSSIENEILIERLKTANQNLLDKLTLLTDDTHLTQKSNIGSPYYLLRISETELQDLKNMIRICIIQ